MDVNFWFFNLGVQKPVEQWTRLGKPEWPEHITVRMNRRQAVTQLASLAKQLEGRLEGASRTRATSRPLTRIGVRSSDT